MAQVDAIKEIEHACDHCTHGIIDQLNRSIKRISAVRWGVARRIVWAWILTIPAPAALGALVYEGLVLVFGVS